MKKENLGWVDALRIFACFLVIMAHCCDPFVAQFNNNRFEFLSGVFWGSFVRCCVPLFVMMTGVLLLPIHEGMREFYSKRIKRVVIALLFWAVVTPFLYYFYFQTGVTSTSPNIVMDTYTLSATFHKIYTTIFNFNYDIIPLWYVYMLIGLYLFIPIINPWLMQAEKKDLRMFLNLWGVTMFLPLIQLIAPALGYEGNYGNNGLLGVCAWNPFGTFYYFSGFLGYFVLAFYLKKFPLQWNLKKRLQVGLPLFVLGYIITSIGFIKVQEYYPTDYEYLEIIWYYFGFNVFIMTYAVYIIVQGMNIKSSPMLRKVASCTFGIFLCHFFIVQVVYDLLYPILTIPAYLQIPLYTCIVFVISYGVVRVLGMWSVTRRFIS